MGLGEAGAARWRGAAATQRAVVMKGGGQTAGRCAGPAQLSGAPDLGAISARARRDLPRTSRREISWRSALPDAAGVVLVRVRLR